MMYRLEGAIPGGLRSGALLVLGAYPEGCGVTST